MADGGIQQPKNLEDELRKMILSNVTMDTSHSNGQPPNANLNVNAQRPPRDPRPEFESPHRGNYGHRGHGEHRGHFGNRGDFSHRGGPSGRGDYGFRGQRGAQAHQQHPGRGFPHHGPSHHGPPHHGPPHHTQRFNNVPSDQIEGFGQFIAQHTVPPQHGLGSGMRPPHRGMHQQPPSRGPFDPNGFQRGPPPDLGPAYAHQSRQLWNAQGQRSQQPFQRAPGYEAQGRYLDQIAADHIPLIEMTQEELQQKDAFRATLEDVFRSIKAADESGKLPTVSLQSFGSLRSGFASKGSDMDLVIVTSDSDHVAEQFSLDKDSLPRLLEDKLLHLGYGARLLGRARVPIVKICEKPTAELLDALVKERARWDGLPTDEVLKPTEGPEVDQQDPHAEGIAVAPLDSQADADTAAEPGFTGGEVPFRSDQRPTEDPHKLGQLDMAHLDLNAVQETSVQTDLKAVQGSKPVKTQKPFTREKAKGPLDFPKDGVGIQCDINFFNPLGLHNTQMLSCYSLCDSRVRPMILFVKAWARRRKINHPYSGTLSSYGYVLMVLHYLINVAQPPVLPNLQLAGEKMDLPIHEIDGWHVRFWDNEAEITQAAKEGSITQNTSPLGALLKGFFQYYASTQGGWGFVWMQDVLSLRSPRGIVSKQDKGWTGAKTETTETKEVRHRYLFAIEDPFEHTHNVARTVTHPGICAIRDEFRRAWRILGAVGRGLAPNDGDLFDELVEDLGPAADLAQGHKPGEEQKQPAGVAIVQTVQTSRGEVLPQQIDVVNGDGNVDATGSGKGDHAV